MNQSQTNNNPLTAFDSTETVFYIESAYQPEINQFIQSNFTEIVELYRSRRLNFCYLPYLLQNKEYKAVVDYNRPYLRNDINDNSIAEIYLKIQNKLTEPFEGAGLVMMDKISDKYQSDNGFPFLNEEPIINQFDKFASLFERIIDDKLLAKGDNKPMFKIIGKKNAHDLEFGIIQDQESEYFKQPTESIISSNICYSVELNADNQFDYEAYRLADDIRTKIQLLKESGSLSLIGDILEEIQGATKQLSPLFITNDYRIFLKDYGMKEVEMPPLPKSVFILFLRHPEGILFKQLANYHDELLSIYRNITVHENIDRAMDSIRAMTDPLNNSINEKCSRIRAAFLEVIADDLAQNYYVTGKRGEPKMITIDRSLVEFQQ